MTARSTNLDGNILGDINRNTRLYRVIPRDRFFALFDRRTNGLVRPSKWEDPFENFILGATVRTEGGELGTFGFTGNLYGQCWTLQNGPC